MATRCWELDGAGRFKGRATLYARGRPSYAEAAIDFIVERAGAGARRVADLGAGTGISTRLLARRFASVVAVEPNHEMAMAARDGGSRVALGRTEALPFPGASLDLVTAFNSFHWFVPAAALAEVDRVLRPDGLFAVVWNDWDLGDDFTREFVALMRSAAGDYPEENREAEVAPLYDCRRFAAIEHRGFAYRHRLDREGLQARLQSMSYVPVAGEAASRMLAELEGLHAAFADEAGFVEHRYVSAVYAARR